MRDASHRHGAKTERTIPYFGPVTSDRRRANPRAHGGVTIVQTCRCGAHRKINSNGGQLERGFWLTCSPAS